MFILLVPKNENARGGAFASVVRGVHLPVRLCPISTRIIIRICWKRLCIRCFVNVILFLTGDFVNSCCTSWSKPGIIWTDLIKKKHPEKGKPDVFSGLKKTIKEPARHQAG
ncbi:MAG: hypothetical protein IJD99_09010 [Clostridia bacterium]|nr:hypothetical protein [Clostridia bacterium]